MEEVCTKIITTIKMFDVFSCSYSTTRSMIGTKTILNKIKRVLECQGPENIQRLNGTLT